MHKILVVEDETILQSVYYQILTSKGYEVNVAGDGFEALQVLEVFTPDLILLDILMPKMDGLEFLERAKLKQNYPNTKVIAFSNFSDIAKLNKVKELGASKSLLKSDVSPSDLVKIIQEELGKK
ncbi:MAG TPA: response regulator [Candidatus Limnocylindrales bacterium]|nr:response regulator [Candidatus Limnocylindrales bacterium]